MQLKHKRTESLFAHDRAFLPLTVAGMDEAGRGPLSGPVVAACVIMPLDTPVDFIDDSKKLSEKRREQLYEQILSTAIAVGIGQADQTEIDSVNILNATKAAMQRAVSAMGNPPDLLLIDAVKGLNVPCKMESIIKGDATSYSIAAASIVAKVTRDRIMRALDETYPQYGFAKNKGYGTAAHIEALKQYGACPVHRQTFIKNFVDGAATESGDDSE
ncbi:MAG: ribonuclease HII [Clostridiales bacterium]|nr:ribonuclease HII [Clostridiales bacterium]